MYAQITTSMEKLLKKHAMFCWDEVFQCNLDVLKEKMITTPIIVFLDWKKEFHVHIDASCIALGFVLTQPGEGDIDHLIVFASRKLSKEKKKYPYAFCFKMYQTRMPKNRFPEFRKFAPRGGEGGKNVFF